MEVVGNARTALDYTDRIACRGVNNVGFVDAKKIVLQNLAVIFRHVLIDTIKRTDLNNIIPLRTIVVVRIWTVNHQ